MFQKVTNFFVALVQKYLPDAFVFAIFLTIASLLLGVAFTGQSFGDMIWHWGNGVWSLLAFSMQMALVLVTGHALASSDLVKKGLKNMTKPINTPEQAIYWVSLVSALACWLNWGFGLVIGALYAREIAKKIKDVDYRLLIASAYSGFLVWHGGISASVMLTLASKDADLAAQTAGAITKAIPTSQTIFSPMNLIISFVIIFTLPLLNRAMHPKELKDRITVRPELLEEPEEDPEMTRNETPADKIENSKVISLLVFIMGFVYLVKYFKANGFDLNLNIVNFIFLVFGILLHQTPRKYVRAVAEATKGASGIILQFPFYAGIMGIMTGMNPEGISLAGKISNWFVSISTAKTFPVFTFWSAGIVNFFVPSGGGQWAVQAPIMMPAGLKLGVDPAVTGMAIAWGDAWTNMIQPFWALPALAIADLNARDIMGFCLMCLIYSGIVISLAFLILPGILM